MIALGLGAYNLALRKVLKKVEVLQKRITKTRWQTQALQGRLDNGEVDPDGTIAQSIEDREQEVAPQIRWIRQLSDLFTHLQCSFPYADKRSIGRVLFADPIGISSSGPNGFTLDWAVIEIKKDAFGGDFEGNTLYIGTSP